MRNRLVWSAGLAGALVLGFLPATAHAQSRADSVSLYQREVFHYSRSGRADPFRSLLNDSEMNIRLEDLTLQGIVYDPNPGRSVAVLARRGSDRPLRARAGDRIGGVRVLAIRNRSVDLLVEEFGVARRGTLELKPAKKGEES